MPSTKKDTDEHPRIIVIGAGISGLACARELHHRNYNVLVVEARSRCGGRLKGERMAPSCTEIDVGGALIHGISNNPVYGVCDQMGVAVCPVEDTVLLNEDGTAVEEQVDQEVASTFNQCLDDTFSKIQTIHDNDKAQDDSFGSLFDTTVPPSLRQDLLFRWHQANLELSCGASFGELGYDWNEDEPYEYTGQHVALPSSWNAVTSTLAEGLDIMYDSPISSIKVVTPDLKKRQERKRLYDERKFAASTRQAVATPSPSRRSRRLQGQDANVRRSSRSNLGIASHKLSISDSTSLSYDDASVRYPTRHSSTNNNAKKVQVTLSSGKVLEADAIVCTLPLGVLKRREQESGHVAFDPPLSPSKRQAVEQLGCGLLNKCVLSFPHVFWEADFEFLGVVGETPFLILNAHVVTGQPILVFMFGGAQAFQVEDMTDKEIVDMCMNALKSACNKTGNDIPEPLDHVVTRWGQDVYARGAFVYIPPGVEGTKQLQAMSEPIVDADTNRPLILFAGEHTTPFHPSTIHGAFHSGIREAYRLDLNFYPDWNKGLDEFEEGQLYKKTFSIKRKFNDNDATENATALSPAPRKRRRRHGVMTLRKRPSTNYANGSKPTKSKLPAKSPVLVKRKGPAPSRRSNRIAGEPPDGGGGGRDKLEDRTLIRSYESYRDWDVIQTKVFPNDHGGDKNYKSIAQLRARYQQVKPKKPARLHPNILSQWIAPKEEDDDESE